MPDRRAASLTARLPVLASRLRWSAVLLLAVAAFLPASAGVELFPFWDTDPALAWAPSTGLNPGVMLALALFAVLAAMMALLADAVEGRAVGMVPAALAAAGSAGVIAHGFIRGDAGLEHMLHGAPWIAGVSAGIAGATLGGNPAIRRVLLAILGGFIAMLLAKALLQLLVEHPATVAEFRRNRDQILAARGWSVGSANALIYERRLTQPEATGWFGLSNVFASFAGAFAAGLGAHCLHARGRARIVPALGAAAAAAALAMSGSKGGAGAALLAIGAAGGLAFMTRWRAASAPRAGAWIGVGLIALVLAAVAVRGVIGEAIAEKSLLFRAHYAVGALRIWLDHPLLGIGPAGFQDAYAGAKLPFSPEIVSSPHAVLLDWTATLGAAGLAWAALLVLAARRAGSEDANTPPPLTRNDYRFTALAIAGATLLAGAAERALATPEASLARLAGLAGWVALSFALLRTLHRPGAARWLAMPIAFALLAHAQIEVTPVWVNAGPLFGLCIGLACPGRPPRRAANTLVNTLPAAVFALIAGIVALAAMPATLRWQDALRESAEFMRPVGEARGEFARFTEMSPESREAFVHELSTRLGVVVPAQRPAIADAIELLHARAIDPTIRSLEEALDARPGHEGTRSALIRLHFTRAYRFGGADRREALEQAVSIAEAGTRVRSESVGAWDRLGTVTGQSARLGRESGLISSDFIEAWLVRSETAWLEVDRRSPYTVRSAVRLMALYDFMNRPTEARRWAAEALRRDGLARLDPLTGLTDEERATARRLSGGPGRAGSP